MPLFGEHIGMKTPGSLLLLALAFISIRFSAAAQNGWTLKKDQDGIRVYNRPGERSRFNDLRVEMDVPARLSSLTALLLDIDNYPNWSFNTKQSYVIKKIGPGELYFYTLIHSPWPASDRDLTLHTRITQDAVSHIITIQVENVTGLVPPKKDLVRVPLSIEHWTVTPLGDGKIRIDYQLQLDPGANVPAWLINTFSIKGPFETFTHLREQLKLPKYHDARSSFIKD